MLTLFTMCALVGGGLLLLSLLGAHHAGLHPDPGVAPLHDPGLESHLPGPGDHGGLLPAPGSWFTLRSLVSFTAFFGLGGLLASWLGLNDSLQLGFALLAGLAVGGFTAFVFRLARMRGELTGQTGSLVGRTGQVLVSPRGEAPGKVLLTAAGQSEQVLARSSDLLSPGDRVLVIAEAGGLLDVRRWDGQ